MWYAHEPLMFIECLVIYADDLSVLCPSFSGMREILKICERYANKNKILFNASKSQILHFSKNEDLGNTTKPYVVYE